MNAAARARRLIWIVMTLAPAVWLIRPMNAQFLPPVALPIGGCNLTFTSPLHIPITGSIGGVVIDDRCKFVYLTNTTWNRVEVFSLDTLTLEAPIQVGAQPMGLDFAAYTKYLYVCNSGGENLSIIDVLSRTEVKRLHIPPAPNSADRPYSIAFGANLLGLVSTGQVTTRMLTVDFISDTVTHRTDFPANDRTRLAASGDRSAIGIVAWSSLPRIFKYSTATNTFTGQSLGNTTPDVAVDMNGSQFTATPGTYVLDGALNLSGTVLGDPGYGGSAVDPTWGIGYRAVASRVDVLNLSTFLKTDELALGDSVSTATFGNLVGRMDISADGALLAVVTDNGFSLVRPWPTAPTGRNLVRNGGFTSPLRTRWQSFTAPATAQIWNSVVGGVLQFNRPAGSTQAAMYQETGMALPAGAPLQADFDLGNSSTARKRISVLLLNADFSDLHVCTFWLPPGLPLSTFRIRTHTTRPWTNAAIYFYAATPGTDGGFYRVDNVSVRSEPALPDDRTECVDPLAPVPPGGPDEADLLVNGDFASGNLTPWATFGTITSQITGGILEFIRPDATPPAGVVLQSTGQAMATNEILTATFALGNSSSVRKRVTAVLHDNDFSDLAACTFWLEPGQILSPYTLRTYTTEAWTNATLSFYAASIGTDQWIQLDDATLRRTPGFTIAGTQCVEPATPVPSIAHGRATRVGARTVLQDRERRLRPSGTSDPRPPTGEPAVLEIAYWLDLTAAARARLTFESWLVAPGSSSGEIQVSLDGITWVTLATVAASDEWRDVTTDLGEWTGRQVAVRFVARPGGASSPMSTVWRLRDVRLLTER
jgi:hypothetical protein